MRQRGAPIQGATVRVDSGELATTDAKGIYIVTNVATGDHSITASASGFKSQTKTATVYEGQETTVNFALKPARGRSQQAHQAAIDHAVRVKNRHEQIIFQIDGVVGMGVSLSEKGQPVIEVYLKEDRAETRARVPASLDDVPVRVVVTGEFEAF